MKINLKQAISTFHPNPSYEQVYFEAVANALDAGADEISISIKIDDFASVKTLELVIKDNGEGFSERNFKKFSSLLEVENNNHKGLGRLVYLVYFDEVKITSFYEESKKREFVFNSKFSGESATVEQMDRADEYTSVFCFKNYRKGRFYTYRYLRPEEIKESLIQHFLPSFFGRKESGGKLNIIVSLDVAYPDPDNSFSSCKVVLNLNDLPELKTTTFTDNSLEFFQSFYIHYSITKDFNKEKSIYTAICIDNRALEYDLLPIESIPDGYQLKFLFISNYFDGKVNSSRQKLDLPDEMTERNLKSKLRLEIGKLINAEIPSVESKNQQVQKNLNNRYPHLQGYFPEHAGGLIVKQAVLEEARNRFFGEQQKILECESLNDDQYQKALELSSRALAEYVIYRRHIILKLRNMTPENDEKELHGLIVPMRKTIKKERFDDDIYNNNVWILDDRFMSYNTILSDEIMAKVVKEIALDDIEDDSRPDITMVFSGNPETEEKVSVVVVELKKHGLPLAKNEEVVSQLRQRARKLLKYFPNKIERIWFYGISDIDPEFRISLREDGFKQLFSHGQIFFKPQNIIVDNENDPFIVDLFIMTYESLINDSESRNETFLRVLKSTISKSIGS
jgi:Histidine kinase-, DNA gyrase B-, and HSP90-like ATPase